MIVALKLFNVWPAIHIFFPHALRIQRYNQWEARDQRDFEMQDGNFQRSVVMKEAEWLMPGDATYELLDISERDGLTVYKIRMV